MQAIQTRVLRPTNTRGARIKAMSWAGDLTVPMPYELDTDAAHMQAAQTLAEKLGWTGNAALGNWQLVQGCLPNGEYCHVLVQPHTLEDERAEECGSPTLGA